MPHWFSRTFSTGFAGFGAAKHLAQQGYAVTLVDGSPNPGGLSAGWRTPQGRAVEAGIKGFWYQVALPPWDACACVYVRACMCRHVYAHVSVQSGLISPIASNCAPVLVWTAPHVSCTHPLLSHTDGPCAHMCMQYHNIFALVRELGIDWPFTDWKTSGFWSPQGLDISAPVFSALPRLPTMLGQFVHTLPLFRCPLTECLVSCVLFKLSRCWGSSCHSLPCFDGSWVLQSLYHRHFVNSGIGMLAHKHITQEQSFVYFA